jgi:hypothetical protein
MQAAKIVAKHKDQDSIELLIRSVSSDRRRTPRAVNRQFPRYSPSRCTVAGEKAGTQTAMYSAPPASGVL